MQVLVESCFDVVLYISEMLDSHSWKHFIRTSKAFYILRTEDSLGKRTHPLCYVLKYGIPDLLNQPVIRDLAIKPLISNICGCYFTKELIQSFKDRGSSTSRGLISKALMASPHMTIELFEETWLNEAPCVKRLGSNENIPISYLRDFLCNRGKSWSFEKAINIRAGMCMRSDLDLSMTSLSPSDIEILTGLEPTSISMFINIVANTKIDQASLRTYKEYIRLRGELHRNPYLTFEELISPPFNQVDYSWNLLVTLPLLTPLDIEQHPEFPWPVDSKAIASFNPLRRDLILSKKGSVSDVIKAIYSNHIPRLNMLYSKGVAILAGTDVSFEEVIEAYLTSNEDLVYHPLCVSLHPKADLATYFELTCYSKSRGSQGLNRGVLPHFNHEFPLRDINDWELLIEESEFSDESGLLSLRDSLTPNIVRAYPNHNWSLINVLLGDNKVTMFDVIRLYKEGLLSLC